MMQKILVVDDDPEIINMMRRYLTVEGYKVICVSNGYEALKIVKESCPDLVILDILMPGLDGFGTLGKLREFSKVPVVILSSLDNEVDKLVGHYMKIDEYLTKPFNPHELVMRIKYLLNHTDGKKIMAKKA